VGKKYMDTDYNDPLFEYLLYTRLQPYIEKVRDWWANMPDLNLHGTGVFGIPDSPPGLMYRFTKSARKSPIRGIQAFPLVPTAYLQISRIAGGTVKMIERVCQDYKFHIEEFIIVEKSNLPSTYNSGQFVAFIPEDVFADAKSLGQWMYLTSTEIMYLAAGHITKEIQDKAKLRI
jgi:hypothetical protein